jgi:DNA excision repair protein ERCC-6
MAASRKLRSILIIAPATMLMHWLSELAKWAPGLRRILIHKSAEKRGDTRGRSADRRMFSSLEKWLGLARADRINEPIDEKDILENGVDSFCGTGYVVLTTFENIRRASDVWIGHNWSYVVMDEGQKVRAIICFSYHHLFVKINIWLFRSEIQMQKLRLLVKDFGLRTVYY